MFEKVDRRQISSGKKGMRANTKREHRQLYYGYGSCFWQSPGIHGEDEMTYTITRQLQWPDGTKIVEISEGGLDYTNPDALCSKYSGEFQEFVDPIEAVEAAINIYESWKNDDQEEDICIGYGCTLGYTMPFEASEVEEIKHWAEEEHKKIPTCSNCGELINPDIDYIVDEWDNPFCSEQCIERAIEKEEKYEMLSEEEGGEL